MTRGYLRGHPIFWNEEEELWRFADTGLPIASDPNRPCFVCGWPPTPEGHDACLGHIPGAGGACCGHGRGNPYVLWENGRSYLSDRKKSP